MNETLQILNNQVRDNGIPDNARNFYTVGQFASLIGDKTISHAAIYKLVREKAIPSTKLGSMILIPAKFVDNFLAKNVVEVAANGTQE